MESGNLWILQLETSSDHLHTVLLHQGLKSVSFELEMNLVFISSRGQYDGHKRKGVHT